MNITWKTWLIVAVAAALAMACAWGIAEGSYGLSLIVGCVGAGFVAVLVLGVPVDTALLAGLIVGYIVGNRGFAQFMPYPGLPLLPGEIGIGVCGGWLLIASALRRKLPLRVDFLNVAILVWIVIGSVRILADFQTYGALALRDFAMVYYALFFFIAQALAESEASRRFLSGTILAATVAIIPLFELFRRFPDFFIDTLTFRGTPLIFIKGDLIATFLAVGIILVHCRWERSRQPIWLVLAAAAFVAIVASENRASLVGLAVVTLWLAFRGRWSLVRIGGVAVVAAVTIVLGAMVFDLISTRNNAFFRFADRIGSLVDFSGKRVYKTADSEYKSDNNQFRLVWWKVVIDDTVANSPWLGLGFGYDLAATFLRQYYPESDDVFSARSPHSVIVTTFARMGIVGLAGLLGILLAIAVRTDRALRSAPQGSTIIAHWLGAWVILVSACFGVVLEGPMGAVVFWTVLGIANGSPHAATGTESTEEGAVGSLNAPADVAEVAAST